MKKLLKPEMEFIKFNAADVITTSGDPSKIKPKDGTTPTQDDTGKSTDNTFVDLVWNNVFE